MSVVPKSIQERVDALVKRHDTLSDPGAGVFFARELEQIYLEVIEHRLPLLNAMKYFPIDRSVNEGANTYTHYIVQKIGEADFIANPADDLPRVDIAKKKQTFNIENIGASYGYTIFEIAAAQMANMSLDRLRGNAVKRAIEEKLNNVFWYGDTALSLYGILSYPWIPRYVFTNPIISATAADTIIAELNNYVNSISELTNGVESPDTLLMPTAPYNHIASTPRSATSDTTILEFFIRNNPYIKEVHPVAELTQAGPSSVHQLVAFRSGDMNVGKLVCPIDFRQLAPQERNLEFIVNAIARCGGFASMYPLAMCIGDVPLA